MRTAILTDVHANLEALGAVLADAKGRRVDRYVCLGDVVGYGASPNECLALLRERCAFCLLGNHDAAVAGRMDYAYYYPAARQALDWTRRCLEPSHLAWLKTLPYTVDEADASYCHASPLEPQAWHYVLAHEQAEEVFAAREMPLVTFIGHSHVPSVFALEAGEVGTVRPEHVRLKKRARYLATIGSVGQPRDRDPRACYGIFDDARRTITYRRVPYDVVAAAEKIEAAGLSPNFARRLHFGY
jgi:diadenosine tetraphosphatase ApaH/serine/threonine PP2A family protein phosphatase